MAEDIKQFHSDSDSSEEPCGRSLPDLTRRLADSLQKPFHCQTCSKKFASKKSLADHMRAHSGEKSFQCEVCAKLFLRSGDLKRHLMMHSGEKPYQCEICEKQFPRKGNLQLHRITHTKARPHQCGLCGRFFAQKSGLTQHMLVHTGIKRFQCELCLKEFARKAYLQKHMLSHRAVPLDCEVCGKTFSASRNLKLHALSHIPHKTYRCYMCEEVFSEKAAYYKHINSHNEPLECQVCFKQFASIYHLREHANVHAVETENIVKELSEDNCDTKLEETSHVNGENCNSPAIEAENIIIEMSVDIHSTDEEHSNGHVVETEKDVEDISANGDETNLGKVSEKRSNVHVIEIKEVKNGKYAKCQVGRRDRDK